MADTVEAEVLHAALDHNWPELHYRLLTMSRREQAQLADACKAIAAQIREVTPQAQRAGGPVNITLPESNWTVGTVITWDGKGWHITAPEEQT